MESEVAETRVPEVNPSPVSAPSIPVYLVHWTAPEWLDSSLRSILASRDCAPAITVVDNSRSLRAGSLPEGVRLLEPDDNLGYSGGANLALADCRRTHPDATMVVIGAHDAHVAPTTLRTLHDVLETCPATGIAAPHLIAPAPSYGGSWNGRTASMITTRSLTESARWASGTLLMIRLACDDELNGFDERFSSYCEDVDYGLRAVDRGWEISVSADAAAWGLGSASSEAGKLISINTGRLRVKRGGWTQAFAVFGERAWSIAGALSVWAGRGRQSEESRRRSRRSAIAQISMLCSVMGSMARWRWKRHQNRATPEGGR